MLSGSHATITAIRELAAGNVRALFGGWVAVPASGMTMAGGPAPAMEEAEEDLCVVNLPG